MNEIIFSLEEFMLDPSTKRFVTRKKLCGENFLEPQFYVAFAFSVENAVFENLVH